MVPFVLGLALLAAPPAPSPVPVEVLDPLGPARWALGAWSCRGTSYSPEGAVQGTYTYAMSARRVLLNRWLELSVVLTPSGAKVPRLEGRDFWGYEPASRRLVEVFLDSQGGYGQGSVSVLDGERIRYRGEGAGSPGERYYDVTFSRVDASHLTVRYLASPDGVTFRPRTEDSCVRTKGVVP